MPSSIKYNDVFNLVKEAWFWAITFFNNIAFTAWAETLACLAAILIVSGDEEVGAYTLPSNTTANETIDGRRRQDL
jgi:hypothetical protein